MRIQQKREMQLHYSKMANDFLSIGIQREKIQLNDNDNILICLTYTKSGVWLKNFGSSNSLYV